MKRRETRSGRDRDKGSRAASNRATSDRATSDEAKKPIAGGEVERQLAALEELAGRLDVQVSYEPMTGVVAGTGGLCRVRGTYRVIIDRRLKPRERAQILADALKRFSPPELAEITATVSSSSPPEPV